MVAKAASLSSNIFKRLLYIVSVFYVSLSRDTKTVTHKYVHLIKDLGILRN